MTRMLCLKDERTHPVFFESTSCAVNTLSYEVSERIFSTSSFGSLEKSAWSTCVSRKCLRVLFSPLCDRHQEHPNRVHFRTRFQTQEVLQSVSVRVPLAFWSRTDQMTDKNKETCPNQILNQQNLTIEH